MVTAQMAAAQQEARKKLLATAVSSIEYVAFGEVMKRELVKKYNLTDRQVEQLLSNVTNDLTQKIRSL